MNGQDLTTPCVYYPLLPTRRSVLTLLQLSGHGRTFTLDMYLHLYLNHGSRD